MTWRSKHPVMAQRIGGNKQKYTVVVMLCVKQFNITETGWTEMKVSMRAGRDKTAQTNSGGQAKKMAEVWERSKALPEKPGDPEHS